MELLENIDLVLDATDNFETRYLINDFCVREKIPWIYGAAVASYGLKMAVIPGVTACLKCVYPEPPQGAQPTCETAGVLGTVTAAIAALQTADAMRILASQTAHAVQVGQAVPPAIFHLTTVDLWSGEIRQIAPPPAIPNALAAASATSFISTAPGAPRSACAAAMRCRFTNATGRWIWPIWRVAWENLRRFARTNSPCASPSTPTT